jgi:uncharacterized protein (TIGR02996 family)
VPAIGASGTVPTDPAERSLAAAVFADPDADGPRLIYADWLDEHGQPDHAEFIRTQIALAGVPPCEQPPECPPPHCPVCRAHGGERVQKLRRRERELLWANRHRWALEAPSADWFDVYTPWDWKYGDQPAVAFVRGFPSKFLCRFSKWLEVGKFLVRCVPGVRVEPRGIAPLRVDSFPDLPWAWYHYHSSEQLFGHIPPEVAPYLTGLPRGAAWHYPTEAAAWDDLSAACVARARDTNRPRRRK